MNLKRILFCLTACAAAIATSVPCAAKRPSGSDLRLLYWNIQNGMWSGQDDNYDRFVEWVKQFDADVCVWCEAQSIYRSGTADRMPEAATMAVRLRSGVEIEAHLDFLRGLGCEVLQGYLFCRPLPAASLENLLAERERLLRNLLAPSGFE